MGHVSHSAETKAPIEVAFEYCSDYKNVPKWMFGVKEFVPVTELTRGVGAAFDTGINLGPTTLHVRIETTRFEENSFISLHTVKGIEATTTWNFEAVDDETTKINAVVDYKVGGGFAGKALDRVIQAVVGPAIRHVDKHLREQIVKHYATKK
ncbi:SRPBCC family protein [Antrihabitans sp. YC2-6]|uniref:SRPBCC family protein n=1 Tax=Antrihabitans sp. YC2-6 TaxID=2799498 RepID=UPI0018F34824|nr:SRPBCC family protein [Antrihabitans sp. YC2-6]MBJ8345321.1 SRPBCC family protein [Antrihabitans sp. YC2-6]